MTRFVRLLDIHGNQHHVNPDHIVDVCSGQDADSEPQYLIWLSTGSDICIGYTTYKRLRDLPDRLFTIGVENAITG
jgi:hypothetical protein